MNTPETPDPDLSSFSIKFTEMRQERDLLKIQVHDFELNLKVAEDKVERLEAELERTKAQLEQTKANLVEKETIIQTIAAAIVTHLKKNNDQSGLLPQLPQGRPSRDRDHLRQVEHVISEAVKSGGK